jgi:membrane associated rhomboid family serine protease
VIPLKDDTPVETTPVVTVALIAANALAFLWQLSVDGVGAVGQVSAQIAGAIPYEILSLTDVDLPDVVPPPFTIFTSMFLHGGITHIASNMLFLWIFGNNVEDALGKVRFVAFYLAGGVVAALVQVVTSAATGDVYTPMVGASGAIAGVLAAYMVLYPRARILTLVFVIVFVQFVRIPASFFIGFWFVLQVVGVLFGGQPGVAVAAHVGGFVAGFVLVRIVGRRPGWRAQRFTW